MGVDGWAMKCQCAYLLHDPLLCADGLSIDLLLREVYVGCASLFLYLVDSSLELGLVRRMHDSE